MIFNMTGSGGGGGDSLSFEVIGGTTAPASPKENTIWVNTDKEITNWMFSAKRPETSSEGMVWFSTSTTSRVGFDAFKKNTMQVNPLYVEQQVKFPNEYQAVEYL